MKNRDLASEAAALQPKLVKWRRDLHSIPELRMETPLTEAYIAERLREIGFENIRTGVGGHGITADLKGPLPGPCVAIRADCDGLPIREETGLPFASKNGNMHACGHDAHTATVLGAATLLYKLKDQLKGSVRFIFQPFEEGGGGARLMIADGALEQVDEIIGMHTGNIMGDEFRSGDLVYTEKYASSNIWAFRAVFRGKGAHVCKPKDAVDPISMAAAATLRIKSEVATRSEGCHNVIAAVTVFNAGTRNNIIPEECFVEGSVRAFDPGLFDEIKRQVTDIINSSASGSGGRADIFTTIDMKSICCDPTVRDGFLSSAAEILPSERIKKLSEPIYMGEDFAMYSEKIPGFYFYLCSKPDGKCYPHHHPKFDIDEKTLSLGAELFAGYVLKRLG